MSNIPLASERMNDVPSPISGGVMDVEHVVPEPAERVGGPLHLDLQAAPAERPRHSAEKRDAETRVAIKLDQFPSLIGAAYDRALRASRRADDPLLGLFSAHRDSTQIPPEASMAKLESVSRIRPRASAPRIGLNLLYLVPGRVGGTEVYARRLVRALADRHPDWEWVAYCGSDARSALEDEQWPSNVQLVSTPRPSAEKGSRAVFELSWLAVRAARDRVQLLHSLGTTSPLVTRCARVVTVHDLIYLHYPDTFPPAARLALKVMVGPGARRAHRVIADSQAGKADIAAHLGVPADRIDVAHLGCNITRVEPSAESDVRTRYSLRGARVCLCVSAALVHKNLDALIAAFGRLAASREDLALVIAGHAGREHDRLRAVADATGHGSRIVLTGWISDPDLEALYGLATCCVYPSLLEGFGLPVLEAMGRGVPIACSDASSLPEVAGDAAELFNGRDVLSIARAIERLLDDRERVRDLVERGLDRVARFTWDGCAVATLASYELALRPGHGRR